MRQALGCVGCKRWEEGDRSSVFTHTPPHLQHPPPALSGLQGQCRWQGQTPGPSFTAFCGKHLNIFSETGDFPTDLVVVGRSGLNSRGQGRLEMPPCKGHLPCPKAWDPAGSGMHLAPGRASKHRPGNARFNTCERWHRTQLATL